MEFIGHASILFGRGGSVVGPGHGAIGFESGEGVLEAGLLFEGRV